ncbi:MAG: serine--tRNA ligase [Patescibacteria group bacterium]
MLDLKFIRENAEKVKTAAKNKNIKVDVDEILRLDDERKNYIPKIEKIRAEKNKASSEIPKLKGEEKEKVLAHMKEISAEEKNLNEELKKVEDALNGLLLIVPQVHSDETPVGKDDTENVELYKIGEVPRFDFDIQDHVALGEKLDILDFPRGVKIAGSRNYFLKNEGVLLEQAILRLTIDMLMEKGFSPFSVPLLVNDAAMTGTAYFPGGEEQAYRVEKDELNLIGTSEVSVCSYHSGEILQESELPRLYAGISPCFRREAGTYGKDTHGLYRVHQFMKVEQVVLCKNDMEESEKMFAMLLKNAEDVLEALGLPYRVVAVCSGDMGRGQYYKNDIETWMPSRKGYGETHSCSSFHEFQSRRLNIRYRDAHGNTQYVHTLNNTAIASPRILIPILEIYQQKDGSVKVPEALQKYMNGMKEIRPKK